MTLADDLRVRRAFVHAETIALGRFLGADEVAGWSRTYRCDCGYRCTAPGDIWDHAQACGPKGQQQLDLEVRP